MRHGVRHCTGMRIGRTSEDVGTHDGAITTRDIDDRHDIGLVTEVGPIIERAMRPSSSVVGGILTVFECWLDDKLFDPYSSTTRIPALPPDPGPRPPEPSD